MVVDCRSACGYRTFVLNLLTHYAQSCAVRVTLVVLCVCICLFVYSFPPPQTSIIMDPKIIIDTNDFTATQKKLFIIMVFAKMLCSEATYSIICLSHLPPKRRWISKGSVEVGKILILTILTKNASFRSYSIFTYFLCAHVYIYMYMYSWGHCDGVMLLINDHHLGNIEWCSLKSVTTTLGLLFSWLQIHCTVIITLGNVASFPSSSCLVHYDTMIMQFYC